MLLYILKCFFIFVIKKLNSAANGQASGTWSFRNIKFLKMILKQFCCFVEIKQVQQKSTKKMYILIKDLCILIF